MTILNHTGAAPRRRASSGSRRLWRLLRRWRRSADAYFNLSDFDQKLIYGLGRDPLDLRRIAHGGQLDAIMRLRRVRRRARHRGRPLTLPAAAPSAPAR